MLLIFFVSLDSLLLTSKYFTSSSIEKVKNGCLNLKITTKEYPGFPTDLQAQLTSALLKIKGLNEINEKIVKEINDEGLIYLTPTKVGEKFVIRFMAGTLEMEENDIDVAYKCIKEKSERM